MKCVYCGESEATEKIGDPNLDMNEEIDWGNEDNWWKVCKDCKEVIPLQMLSSVPNPDLQKYCNEKLDEIAKRTKKPIMNAVIYKKNNDEYDTASVTFTGKD